jgi:hypothetical protein
MKKATKRIVWVSVVTALAVGSIGAIAVKPVLLQSVDQGLACAMHMCSGTAFRTVIPSATKPRLNYTTPPIAPPADRRSFVR